MKGEIMIADQMGVRPLAQFLQEVGPFTVQGGYIVRYARWISDTELLLRGAQFGRQFGRVPELKQATGLFIPGISQWGAEAEQEWLAKHLDLGFYHLAGPIAARIDAEARRALGRPQRRPHKPGPFTPPTSTLPPLWDDPNLEGASRSVRQLWEAFRGLSGGKGQAVTVEQLLPASKLPLREYEDAIMQLEYVYRRVHVTLELVEGGKQRVVWTYKFTGPT